MEPSQLDKLKGPNQAKLVRRVGGIKLDASSWEIYLHEPTSNATDVKFLVLNVPSKLQTVYTSFPRRLKLHRQRFPVRMVFQLLLLVPNAPHYSVDV